jgi:hypothetical protein
MQVRLLVHKYPRFVLVCALALAAVPAGAVVKYRVLHNFTNGPDGGTPGFNAILDSNGNLYGVTYGGGPECQSKRYCGTVFELTRQANGRWLEKVLHNFTTLSEGDGPNGGPALDEKGNLYGAARGGPNGTAALYQLVPGRRGWDYSLIYDEGAGLSVLFDTANNIYGFIGPGQYGAGAVSELTRGSKGWSLKTLYSFCSQNQCSDGEGPIAPLTWDAVGNLYGTTLHGGNGPPKCRNSGLGCGVAFQMTPKSDGTWTYHVLHRFAAFKTDGQFPDGGLVVDASGTAYGVTAYGGVHGNGTVFTLTPSSGGRWKQTVLYDFPDCANGCLPGTTLVFDKAGDLYGVSSGGLADCQGYTCGLIFKLTPQAGGKWKYSVVHKFTGTDGGFPNGVIMDDKGNLYGTTQAFGKYGYGVAFEITP